MNGCKEVNFSFTPGSYFAGDTCNIIDNPNSNYTSSYYLNLSKFNYERTSSATGGAIRICKYDMNKEPLGMVYNSLDNTIGEFSVDLDPNYLYRISYYSGRFSNLKGYQCNVGIGSMANELAFGKLTFLDEIGTIIPFVIPLIAFALGFLLLKKMIKRGNQGHA